MARPPRPRSAKRASVGPEKVEPSAATHAIFTSLMGESVSDTASAKVLLNGHLQRHNHCFINFWASRRCLIPVFSVFNEMGDG